MEKIVCGVHDSVCMLKTGVKEGPNKGKSFYPDKEKRNPLSDTHLQPSSLPPVRNPFKAPSKLDNESEWKKMQNGGVNEKGREDKDSKASKRSEGRESNQKENVQSGGGAAVEEGGDTYRGKQLPPGMKVKKRVSDEERRSPKGNSVEEKTEEENAEQRKSDRAVSTSAVSADCSEKTNQTSQDPHKHSPQKPTAAEARQVKEADPSVRKSGSKSAPSSSTMAYRDPDNTKSPTCDKPTQSESKNHQHSNKDDDDDVVLVSVKPPAQKTPPAAAVQKPLTSFQGFQPASKVKGQQQDPKGLHNLLTVQLQQKKATLSAVNVAALPDKGERLRTQVKELEDALESLSLTAAAQPATESEGEGHSSSGASPGTSQVNPFSRQGGTILLPAPPAPGPYQHQASGSSLGLSMSQGYSQVFGVNPQVQTFYGGRMTDNRLLAVKNATCETIDHLHKSLETCPDPEAEAPDPKGIKVSLLAHQRRALAWLLWREAQSPCGGILADDMGLGKTLTMISLILTKKLKAKEEDEKKEEKKLEKWLSKTDSSLVASKGTLIICPASLIHHWKKEIERHVKSGRLTVYLYHGPNREKNARALSEYDVVVTTYSLVSKEIPVQKEESDKPTEETDVVVDNGSKRGRERLNILTRTLLLRRTKTQTDSAGKPLVHTHIHTHSHTHWTLSADSRSQADVKC
ncbi:hypothetical protein INR49_026975 [Caranx melampygus]|nr:hypothetical protein INR49_026975 [Caranx melampygus]